MKSASALRPKDHLSYHLHRRQMWMQILLPILLTLLVFMGVIVLTSLATFRGNGDVDRWAAISTIWLVLPVMIAGLIFLILLIAVIYLLARITMMIPPYSYQAQHIAHRIEGGVKRIAEMFREPGLALRELASLVRTFIENARKSNSA